MEFTLRGPGHKETTAPVILPHGNKIVTVDGTLAFATGHFPTGHFPRKTIIITDPRLHKLNVFEGVLLFKILPPFSIECKISGKYNKGILSLNNPRIIQLIKEVYILFKIIGVIDESRERYMLVHLDMPTRAFFEDHTFHQDRIHGSTASKIIEGQILKIEDKRSDYTVIISPPDMDSNIKSTHVKLTTVRGSPIIPGFMGSNSFIAIANKPFLHSSPPASYEEMIRDIETLPEEQFKLKRAQCIIEEIEEEGALHHMWESIRQKQPIKINLDDQHYTTLSSYSYDEHIDMSNEPYIDSLLGGRRTKKHKKKRRTIRSRRRK
jgi:hypothetical protein